MIKLFKIIFILSVFLCSFRAEANFDENKARYFLRTTGNELIEALNTEDLEEKYDMLDQMFEQKFDTDYMGRFVLGKYRKSFTQEELKLYDELFKRYIKSLYKSYASDFDASDIHFEVAQIKPSEKYTEGIVSVLLPEKYRTETLQSVTIVFRLVPRGDSYVISDVLLGDINVLVWLRSRFTEMMQEDEEEPQWFLESLEDLTKSNEYNIQKTIE